MEEVNDGKGMNGGGGPPKVAATGEWVAKFYFLPHISRFSVARFVNGGSTSRYSFSTVIGPWNEKTSFSGGSPSKRGTAKV